MGQNRDQRDMGRNRNEEETGEPLQLDEKQKDQKIGQPHQGGQHPDRPGQTRQDEKQQKPA